MIDGRSAVVSRSGRVVIVSDRRGAAGGSGVSTGVVRRRVRFVVHRLDDEHQTGRAGRASPAVAAAAAAAVVATHRRHVGRQHLRVRDVGQVGRSRVGRRRRLRLLREHRAHVGFLGAAFQSAAGRDRHLFVEFFDHLYTNTITSYARDGDRQARVLCPPPTRSAMRTLPNCCCSNLLLLLCKLSSLCQLLPGSLWLLDILDNSPENVDVNETGFRIATGVHFVSQRGQMTLRPKPFPLPRGWRL